MNLESHRLKAASYRKNHDDERKTFESHCKQVILDCHRRQFAVKLNVKTVQQVLVNEAEKFTFDWLKKYFYKISRKIPKPVNVWPVNVSPTTV